MINAIANQPSPQNVLINKLKNFKIADPQFVLSVDPASSPEEMENLIWQGIGGHEILSLARRDLVDGKNINYELISGLIQLSQEYSPKTIMSIENSSPLYFNAFGIRFDLYLPSPQNLEGLGIIPPLKNPISIDDKNNITIYVLNVKDSYEVEVQSLTAEEVLRDTIYGEGNL